MQTHAEPGTEFGIAPPFWRGRDALVVADERNGQILGWNPAAVALFGYTPAEAAALRLSALLPALDPTSLAGQSSPFAPDRPTAVTRELAAPHKSGQELQVELTLAPLARPDGSPGHVLAILRDTSEQKQAAAERLRLIEESHALQVVAAELSSRRDLSGLLDAIVERTRSVLGARACTVWFRDDDGTLALRAESGVAERYRRWRESLPRQRIDAMIDAQIGVGRPSFIPDLPASIRDLDPEAADRIETEGIVSVLRLPLRLPSGELTGWLNLLHGERRYDDGEVRLAQAFADQIAIALHNAQLVEQERAAREAAARQLERMTLLTEITRQLLAATELETVLRVVTESAWRLCDARTATIMLADTEGSGLTLQAFGTETDALRGGRVVGTRMNAASFAGTPFDRALRERTAVATEDLRRLPPSLPRDRGLEFGLLSGITAPLLVEGTPLGVLNVSDTRVRAFTSEDIALVQALADQAALAIEHARLTRRGQDAAVLEERSRLARDLHDSVTQSLFSMSLITEALPRLLERRPERAREQIAQINELSRSGLAELRSLIFELRPLALTNEGLVAALEKHAAAYQRREHLTVSLDVRGEQRLPAAIEEALFRIAQECLNNVAKHARASRVDLRLTTGDRAVELAVVDNGVGFDGTAPSAGRRSLGMTSMHERAMLLGGTCEVASAPGAGTSISVRLPLAAAEAGR